MTDDSSFTSPHTRVWVTFKETTVILSCVKDPSIYLSFSRPGEGNRLLPSKREGWRGA